MGNRAECPVCKCYSSNVYRALHYDNEPCPNCECPHSILVKWSNLEDELQELKAKCIDKDLIKQIKDVEVENAVLKTKLSRLKNVLDYDGEVLNPLMSAINILYDKEEDDDNRADSCPY